MSLTVLIILILVVLGGILFIILNLKRTKLVQTEKFFCLPGFTFEYPIFKEWEVITVDKTGEDECTIWLNWPEDKIMFEMASQIKISKVKEIGLVYLNKSKIEGAPSPWAKKNPQGIIYDLIGPKKDVEKMESSILQFYTEDFGARLELISVSEKYGFSTKEFWKNVIKSFTIQ